MRAKINLLALMELVFKAPAHQRSLSFSLIAATARIPNNEVSGDEILSLRSRLCEISLFLSDTDLAVHIPLPLALSKVEMLVMKALSHGLVRGEQQSVPL
jgi:hypothetical protein